MSETPPLHDPAALRAAVLAAVDRLPPAARRAARERLCNLSRPAARTPVRRALQVLHILLSERPVRVSVPTMAQRLGVDKRSIYHALDWLTGQGWPVDSRLQRGWTYEAEEGPDA